MKRSFAAKRTPRKIGHDEDKPSTNSVGDAPNTDPVVRRPGLSSKPKKSSSLRLSFGPDSKSTETGQDESDDVFAPKKSHLSRLAQENNARSKPLRTSLSSEHLPFRTGVSDDQPSYSTSYLNELRNSTPSRPKDSESPGSQALDIASKFGVGAVLHPTHPSIPSDAEIREKKERRARLAKEEAAAEFIGLSSDASSDSVEDDEDGNLVLRQKSKKSRHPESRLQREDEDIAEGYDELVEDGRVALGRKAEREQARRRRKEMEEQIRMAEGGDGGEGVDGEDDDDGERDEEEAARHAAYEAAQTAAGTYGIPGASGRRRDQEQAAAREKARGPKKMTPIPDLASVIARMREELKSKEQAKMMKLRELDELKREKGEIAVEEVRIQEALREAGKRYDELRAEAGIQGQSNGSETKDVVVAERGLESFGSTPMAVDGDSSDE